MQFYEEEFVMKLVRNICALLLMTAVAAPLQAGVIYNSKDEVPFGFYNECTNEGFFGFLTLHILLRETVDGAGGFHYGFHYQPQGGVMVGDDSGNIYHATGVTQEAGNIGVSGLPFEFTFVNIGTFITPGQGANLRLHETIHVTVNALGEVTSEVVNVWEECN
jgi:hypothetical protein